MTWSYETKSGLFSLLKFMINPFKRNTSGKSTQEILDDAVQTKIAKLIVEGIKKDLDKKLPVLVEAYFKGHSTKLDALSNKVEGVEKNTSNILNELQDQGDERVEHTKQIGFLKIIMEGVDEHIVNRSKSLQESVKEAAKDGVHEAVPSSMQAFVEPKKNKLVVVEAKGFFRKIFGSKKGVRE